MVLGLLSLTRDSLLAPLGLLPYTRLFIFEFLDMIIMAFAIGYIFSDYLRPVGGDPLVEYRRSRWERVKIAALVAGPAVVFHELAHKAVAMAFGAQATLYAPYGFYLLVTLLKAIGFPFLFFVGGFVSHTPLPPLASSLVAFSGPAANFLMWGLAVSLARRGKLKKAWLPYAAPFARINLLLGFFNLLPLPGFDGFSGVMGLFRAIF